jgi:uncharacterized SAM-dependent methyltransferase
MPEKNVIYLALITIRRLEKSFGLEQVVKSSHFESALKKFQNKLDAEREVTVRWDE